MLGFVIFVIVATVLCIIFCIVCRILWVKTEWFWPDPFGIIAGVFGGFGVIASCICVPAYIDLQKEYVKCIAQIVSLERDSMVEGRFCLGSGTIEEKQYYFYYSKVGENTYKLGKLECYNAYIVETDQYKPSIYEIKEKDELKYYNIYVPFGTMVVSYSI